MTTKTKKPKPYRRTRGFGTIIPNKRKTGKTYTILFTLHDGRRRKRTLLDKAGAEEKLGEIAKANRQRDSIESILRLVDGDKVKPKSSAPTFRVCVERWLAWMPVRPQKPVRPATLKQYKDRINALLETVDWSDWPIDTISKQHIQTELTRKRDADVSGATCNRILSAVSQTFAFAVESGSCSENVTRGIKRYTEGARDVYADKDAALWLLKTAREKFEPDFADYLSFCALAGFRRGELLRVVRNGIVESEGMRWRQVGRDAIKTEKGSTKSKDVRSVPITAPLRPVIAKRRKRCFKSGGADGLVFDLKDAWLRKRWGELLALAVKAKKLPRSRGPKGDKRLRLHDWRRSFGVLIGEHCEVHVVAKLLGHRDIHTTMRYLEGTDKRVQEAADAFGEAWGT